MNVRRFAQAASRLILNKAIAKKAGALPTLSLLALILPLSTHAQSGDWQPNWTQIDQDGKPVESPWWGMLFIGTLTGKATVTGNYKDMTAWYNLDPGDRSFAYGPSPNPPGQAQSFLFGGPDQLNQAGLTFGAGASNYWGIGNSRSDVFGDLGNGIPTETATGGISVHESNPTKLRLQWTPIYEGEDDPAPAPPPAPDHVDLLVNTDLSASASIFNAASIGGLVKGQGGRASSATISESKFGGSVTATISDADPYNPAGNPPHLHSLHLIKAPTKGGIAEIEMDTTGDAQASAPSVSSDITLSTASASGGALAWAVFDKREVAIDPLGHEVTYHRGSLIDPMTGMTYPGPEANKPGDDSLQVDIGLPLYNHTGTNGDYSVSYQPIVGYSGTPNDGDNKGDTFDLEEQLKGQSESGTLPLFVGGDDPSATTYNIPPLKVVYQSPHVYFDQKPYPYESDYDYGHPHLDKGDAGSSEDGVKLKYTFISDGATANYALNVNLHLPYENWQLDNTSQDNSPIEGVDTDPASQMAQYSVTVKYSTVQNLMALADQTGSAGLTAIATLVAEDPAAAACIAVLGYAADKAGPAGGSSSMGDSFQDWNTAVAKGLVSGIDLSNYGTLTEDQQRAIWAQCTWALVQQVPIATYYWEAEHYAGLGYTGQSHATVTQALDPVFYHSYTYNGPSILPPIVGGPIRYDPSA